MAAEPIYLLDFRNLRVTKLEPTDERLEEARRASESRERGIKFAALGAPAESKD